MSQLNDIENYIVDVPDFPKKGIIFKDIAPVLAHKFKETIDELAKKIHWDGIDAVAGIESRGFIFGAALSQKLGIGFIPIRKKGKLPPPTLSEDYTLEYGEDSLEIKADYKKIKKVVIVDDVIATGGTLKATVKLCEKAGLEPQCCLSLINLKFLNDLEGLELSIQCLFEY